MAVSYYTFPGLNYSAMSARQKLNLSLERGQGMQKRILKAVCDFYQCSEIDVKKKCRKRQYVWCRHVYYYLCSVLTSMSLIEIAEEFEQDHTTVIHGKETVKDIMNTDPEKKKEVMEIENLLS